VAAVKQTKMVAIAEASEQQRTDEEKEKIEQQLKERLLRAETRVREQEEQIAEYRLQKRKLDDAVAAMARQTQVLYKERDELAGRLADATSKIGTLVRTASQIHTQEEVRSLTRSLAPPTVPMHSRSLTHSIDHSINSSKYRSWTTLKTRTRSTR